MRTRARLLVAVLAFGGLGCASALPPRGTPPAVGTEPGAADAAAAAEAMAQADAAWARRPEIAAVVAARDAYLAAARAAPDDAAAIAGATRALVWLAHHEDDSQKRQSVAAEAVHVALDCAERDATSAACPYWLALALGVQADARRATAVDGVKRMVPLLEQAIEADPRQDDAGPHRVLARVLAQAPGWPTGPGDADAAVEHADAAVLLAPEHAPNWLALGEARAAAGDPAGSRRAYERALELARRARQQGHPDAAEWLRDAEAALEEGS